MHAVERPVEAIVCKLERGREMQRTDALKSCTGVQTGRKELLNTVRNRRRNETSCVEKARVL